jgi:restriction system protein
MIELVRTSMSMTDEELTVRHRGDGSRTEVEYRLAWARTVLKSEGLIERVQPQVWRLTEKGHHVANVTDSERPIQLNRL